MTVGEKLRKQNKHMRIVLSPKVGSGSSEFTVLQTTGTLSPRHGTTVSERQAQEYINEGYTVTVKRQPR